METGKTLNLTGNTFDTLQKNQEDEKNKNGEFRTGPVHNQPVNYSNLNKKLDFIPGKNDVKGFNDLIDDIHQNQVNVQDNSIVEVKQNNGLLNYLYGDGVMDNVEENLPKPVRNPVEDEKNRVKLLQEDIKIFYKTEQYRREFEKGGTDSFNDVANQLARVDRYVVNEKADYVRELNSMFGQLKNSVEKYFELHASKRKTAKGLRRIAMMERLEELFYNQDSGNFISAQEELNDNCNKKIEDCRCEALNDTNMAKELEIREYLVTGSHKGCTSMQGRLHETRDNRFLKEGTPAECMDRFLSTILRIQPTAEMLSPEYIHRHSTETLETIRLIEAFDKIRSIAAESEREDNLGDSPVRNAYLAAVAGLSGKDRSKFSDAAERLHKLRIYYASVIMANGVADIYKIGDSMYDDGADGIYGLEVSDLKLKRRVLKKELLEDIQKNNSLMDKLDFKRHVPAPGQRNITLNSLKIYRKSLEQRELSELYLAQNLDAYRLNYLAVNGQKIDDFEKRRKIAEKLVPGYRLNSEGISENRIETGRKDLSDMVMKGLFGTPSQLKKLVLYLAKCVNTMSVNEGDLSKEAMPELHTKLAFCTTIIETMDSLVELLGEDRLTDADKRYIDICKKEGMSEIGRYDRIPEEYLRLQAERNEELESFYKDNPLYFLQEKPVTDNKGKLIEDTIENRDLMESAVIFGKFGNSSKDSHDAVRHFYEKYLLVNLTIQKFDIEYVSANRAEIRNYINLLRAYPYVKSWISTHDPEFTLEAYLREYGIDFSKKNGLDNTNFNNLERQNELLCETLSAMCQYDNITDTDNYSSDLHVLGRSTTDNTQLNARRDMLLQQSTEKNEIYKGVPAKIQNDTFRIILRITSKHKFLNSELVKDASAMLSGSEFLNWITKGAERIEDNFFKKYKLIPDEAKLREYSEKISGCFEKLSENDKKILRGMPDIIFPEDIEAIKQGTCRKCPYLFYNIDDAQLDHIIKSGTIEDKEYLYYFVTSKTFMKDTDGENERYKKVKNILKDEYDELEASHRQNGDRHDELEKRLTARYICYAGAGGRMAEHIKRNLGLVPGEVTAPVEQLMFAVILFGKQMSNYCHNLIKLTYNREAELFSYTYVMKYTAFLEHSANFALTAGHDQAFIPGLLDFLGITDKKTQEDLKKNITDRIDNSDIGKALNAYYKISRGYFMELIRQE